MSLRAIICDVYQTILAVSSPPVDAEARWTALLRNVLEATPGLSLKEFSAATIVIIAREHGVARARGVQYPEIFWPAVVGEVLPEFTRLPPDAQDEFLWQQAQLMRSVQLMPGAADALRKVLARNLALGAASNAQPYTLRELDAALASAGLSRRIFDPALCFFSFEQGFSKPDPGVFRFLTERLHLRGIEPGATMMIGDRLDNDIIPARSLGWQTWHFTQQPAAQNGQKGNWSQFSAWLG